MSTTPRSLRSAIRAVTPDRVRLGVALLRRAGRDVRARPRFAVRPSGEAEVFRHSVVEVVQEIKPTAFFEGKLSNIRLGAALLDGVVVAPGETLSFWKLVGAPTAAAGFAIGRSIRDGAVGGEIGGGLCQLSGITYEAGLRAGLHVLERSAHSRDLYAEADRFTPLGLDATVVWPYKDMRLLNLLATPLQFRFAVQDLTIHASVHAALPLDPAMLEIERIDHDGWRKVRVVRRMAGGDAEPISDDLYLFSPVASA